MSTSEEQRTVIIEKERGSEIGAFVLGALVGAGLALLLAPGSGAETQQRIREHAKRLRDATEDRVRGLRDDFGSHVESAKGVVEQGRQIASGARADLEDKLERSKAAYRAGVDAAREAARTPPRPAEDAEPPEEAASQAPSST